MQKWRLGLAWWSSRCDRISVVTDSARRPEDERGATANERDRVADEREIKYEMRRTQADERERLAEQREIDQDRREAQEARRQRWSDARADERDRHADERDRHADERDRVAEERDRDADERDRDADERDRDADERDRLADQREIDAEILATVRATGESRLTELPTMASLRQRLASLALEVARVEHEVATTYDRQADRDVGRAGDLHARADAARRFAAIEQEAARRFGQG